MATWSGIVLETGGRSDFWAVARPHRIEGRTADVSKSILLVDPSADLKSLFRIARSLSEELCSAAPVLAGQSTVDYLHVQALERGQVRRCLEFSAEEGGWVRNHGIAQPWEEALFFGGWEVGALDELQASWPDMLFDQLSEQDMARCRLARAERDPSKIMDLLHPSSLLPLFRVVRGMGHGPDHPEGTIRGPWWKLW